MIELKVNSKVVYKGGANPHDVPLVIGNLYTITRIGVYSNGVNIKVNSYVRWFSIKHFESVITHRTKKINNILE